MDLKNLLTITQAATIVGVSRQRFHEMIKTYGLRTFPINTRLTMVPKSELRKIPDDRPPGPISNRNK